MCGCLFIIVIHIVTICSVIFFVEKEFCSWNVDEVKACLPILPNQSASFVVKILAVCDFMGTSKQISDSSKLIVLIFIDELTLV